MQDQPTIENQHKMSLCTLLEAGLALSKAYLNKCVAYVLSHRIFTIVKYLAAKSSRITAKILLAPKQSQKETVP